MPSRHSCNYKSLSAKAAKEEIRKEKRLEEEKQKEALLWKDEVTEAKLNKKETIINKQQEKLQRKLENRKLAEEENIKFAGSNKKNACASTKLSRAEIQRRALLTSMNAAKQSEPEDLLFENPNRILENERKLAEEKSIEFVSASSVAEFLDATNTSTSVDRFPEKQMKAAFAAFEEKQIPLLKNEFPTLKRSQLQEKLWKMWLKSPENPANLSS